RNAGAEKLLPALFPDLEEDVLGERIQIGRDALEDRRIETQQRAAALVRRELRLADLERQLAPAARRVLEVRQAVAVVVDTVAARLTAAARKGRRRDGGRGRRGALRARGRRGRQERRERHVGADAVARAGAGPGGTVRRAPPVVGGV